MSDETTREAYAKRSRKDLIDQILCNVGHVRLLQWEWGKSEERLARLRVKHEETVRRLEEANAVIIEASRTLTHDHPVFWILDDLDGSGDACTRLHELGYRRTGDGSWYPPERSGNG